MGAWNISNFDNDTAGDWLYEFEENPSIVFLEKTIDSVFKEEYIDSDIALEALAAIEVITLIKGDSKEKREELEALENINFEVLGNEINATLYNKSIKCCNLILNEENSELYDLWEESDSLDDWKDVILDLKQRIEILMKDSNN